ncbi:MAG: hypothetical protein QUS13_12990, partial [Smithella sp.]|nr:hypothetical protein [Smithella sp.]
DLTSSTDYATLNHIFTVPAGCSSIKISLLAKNAGDIVWFDSISLSDVVYDSGTVTIASTTTEYINTGLTQKSDCLVRISVYYSSGTAAVGEIILGNKQSIGTMKYSPAIGITDYSTKEVDAYGHYSITERTFSKKLSCNLLIANTSLDTVYALFTQYRSTAVVWVASTSYNSMVLYGFYRDFSITISYPNYSEASLEIEGLT